MNSDSDVFFDVLVITIVRRESTFFSMLCSLNLSVVFPEKDRRKDNICSIPTKTEENCLFNGYELDV